MGEKLKFALFSALAAIIAGYGSLLALGFAEPSAESVTSMAWKSAFIVLPAGLAAAISAWYRFELRLGLVLATGKSAFRFAFKVIVGAFGLYLPLLLVSLFIMLRSADWLQAGDGLVQGLVAMLPSLLVLTFVVWSSALAVCIVPAFLLQWAVCHFVIFRAAKARKQVKK